MALVLLEQIPRRVRRGDTIEYAPELSELAEADLSQDQLSYHFVSADHQGEVAAAVLDDRYVLTLDTTDLPEGEYAWKGTLSSGGKSRTVEEGILLMAPGSLAPPVRDTRSFALTALAKIEDLLLEGADSGTIAFSAGGTSISWESKGELLVIRDRLRREVLAERRARHLGLQVGDPVKLRVRF